MRQRSYRAVAPGLPEVVEIINACFVRWSARARDVGLLATTHLEGISTNGTVTWTLSNGDSLQLSVSDLSKDEDVWILFKDLYRVPDEDAEIMNEDMEVWKDDAY